MKPGDSTLAVEKESWRDRLFGETATSNLKLRSVRGGAIAIVVQGLTFGLQTGSTMILARLLSPADFGLQGMVLAVTGILALFRDAGLSVVTVQRNSLTHGETSNLFWINVSVGAALALLAAGIAPLLAAFYKEPRLFFVTVVSSASFVFNGLAVQHRALLQRSMRFIAMGAVDVLSLASSAAVGIGMAVGGCGYWSLVGTAVTGSVVSAVGSWIALPWMPGKPKKDCEIRSMLHFGGVVTLNSLVVYVAYNLEKVLLGRVCGAEGLGLYGRAYQLVNLPVQQLNSSLNSVAFPALSRIQGDPERLRRSFLKGYGVLISVTVPAVLAFAVYAEEIVRVMLGAKWNDAADILRLLAPTALAFALVNPFGWLLQAVGRVVRSLKIALMIAPVVMLGIIAGLGQGPKGVALGYSIAMLLLVVPIVAWARHGTEITLADVWATVKGPFLSGVLAGGAGLVLKIALQGCLNPVAQLFVGMVVCSAVYAWSLLILMGKKEEYLDLLSHLVQRSEPVG